MRAVVHIGMSKTGSTAIQTTILANRALLRKQGVFYPNFRGERASQISLSAYSTLAAGEPLPHYIAQTLQLTTPESREEFLETFPARFHSAVNNSGLDSTDGVILLSNEVFSASMRTEPEFRAILDLLDARFDEVSFLVYIRRTEDRILSRYSQSLRGGETRSLGEYLTSPALYDTWPVLQRWSNAVGKERLNIRLLDRDFLVGGDVIKDFFAQVGIDTKTLFTGARSNEAYWAEAVPFLIEMNKLLASKTGQPVQALRQRMIAALDERARNHDRLTLTAEQTLEIRKRGDPHEENVRREFFPERDTLFPPRPIPETVSATTVDPTAAMALTTLEILQDWWSELNVASESRKALNAKPPEEP